MLSTALALTAVAPAGASVVEVIKDCRDGTLDRSYSVRELRAAERSLPSDQVEYGDCADALRDAQLDARRERARAKDDGGGGSSGSGGTGSGDGAAGERGGGPAEATGGAQPTPDEDVQALTQEQGKAGSSAPPPEFSLGGARVVPRAPAGSGLPLPLMLAAVAAGLLGLAGAWHVTRRSLGGPVAALRLFRR